MVDPLIIGAIVVGALSAASYYQQRKMQRQAEKQANEMASHQISGHDSNRALYTVYGRALIGTTTIYKRVSRRNIPMANANFTNFVGGGGSPSTESKTYGLNRFLYRISSLSNGPINGIENVLIDGEKYTANRFTAGHTKHFEAAVSLGPTAGNHFANLRTSYATDFSAWGADKKGQGVAYVVERFWFDKSNPAYQGEPSTQYLVKGRSLYDPRLDSTVTGGSGSHRSDTPSTWAFSDNPALALLDMLTNDEYGRGVSHADCNMATFITAANKCDTLVDIPARATNTTGATMVVYDPHTGTTYEIPDNGTISNYRIDQVTTGSNANKQKRFRLNMAVDNSKEVLDNIQQILQSFRGNLHHINGEYVVHMDDVASPVLTLTDDDIIGGLKIAQGDRKQRINRMTVKFLNANKHYKTDQVSWPPIDSDASSQYQTYLTADSGEKLHKTVTLTGCTDYYQAEDIAEYLVRESRVTLAVNGTFGSRCFNLVPGDVISLTYDSAGYSGKYFIVDQVGVDVSSMNVKLSLREYDSSVYTWNTARGNEPVALYFDADQQYNATPTSLTLGTVSSAVITLADGTATVSLVVPYSGVPEEATAVEIGWAPTGTSDYTTNVMQEDATKTKFQLGIDNQDIDIRVRYIVTNADGLQMPSGYTSTTFTLPAVSGTRLDGMEDNATNNTGVLADRDTVDTTHIEDDAVTVDKIANTLESTNYVAGTSGWRLTTAGDFEAGDGTFRGALTATSGSIANSVTIGGTAASTVESGAAAGATASQVNKGLALLLNEDANGSANNGEAGLVGTDKNGVPATGTNGFIVYKGSKITVERGQYSSNFTILTNVANKRGFICFDANKTEPFTMAGYNDLDVAFVWKEGDQWYYDQNASTGVSFTPSSITGTQTGTDGTTTPDLVAIGWLETSTADLILTGGLFEPIALESAPFSGDVYNSGTIGGIEITGSHIQSSNFVSGTSGFKLESDGTFEAGDGLFRGDIQATVLDVENANVHGTLTATNIAAGIVTADTLAADVFAEFDDRYGGSGGFYRADNDEFFDGSATKYVTLPTVTHDDSKSIRFQCNLVHSWGTTNQYGGTDGLKLRVTFEYSTDNTTWAKVPGSGENSQDYYERSATVTIYTVTAGFDIAADIRYTMTGSSLSDNTAYYFRVKIEYVQSTNAFTSAAAGSNNGVPIKFNVQQTSGLTAAAGDADTVDGLQASQFLRSDTSDTFSGNLTVTGNLTVQGSQTQLDTQTLTVEDNNIVLNYSTGDSSGSADNAGITIQDAVNSTTDASLLWKATGDYFQFSHPINAISSASNAYAAEFRGAPQPQGPSGMVSNGVKITAGSSSTDTVLLVQELDNTAILTINGFGQTTFANSVTIDGVSVTSTKMGQWSTAYTYSQVGHLPLAGGTVAGSVIIDSGTAMGLKIEHDSFANALELHREHETNAPAIRFTNNSTTTPQIGILFATHVDKALKWRDGTSSNSYRLFTDNYHPNADEWTDAIDLTVTLTGDVTGTATESIDGSANKTISITTSYSESDTLDSVTGRGNTTTNDIAVGSVAIGSDTIIGSNTRITAGDGTTSKAGIGFLGSSSTGLSYSSSRDRISFLSGGTVRAWIQTPSSNPIVDAFYFDGSGSVNGSIGWSGGSSTNANTAYTYSQVGHLPLAGGTTTGDVTIGGDLVVNEKITISGSSSHIAMQEDHFVYRRFEMDAVDNDTQVYILLCEFAANNDVNGTITMDRTSGLRHAAVIDVLLSSGNGTTPVGTMRVMGTSGHTSGLSYRLVKGTHTDSKVYIAVELNNPDGYYETTGAYFTGRIKTTVSSTELTAVSDLTSKSNFDVQSVHQVGQDEILTAETDTLDSVTDRGATTTNSITINDLTVNDITASGDVILGGSTDIDMAGSATGQLKIQGNGYAGAIALNDDAMHIYHNSSLRNLVLGVNETAIITLKTGQIDTEQPIYASDDLPLAQYHSTTTSAYFGSTGRSNLVLASINKPRWRDNNSVLHDVVIADQSQNVTLGTISSGAITSSSTVTTGTLSAAGSTNVYAATFTGATGPSVTSLGLNVKTLDGANDVALLVEKTDGTDLFKITGQGVGSFSQRISVQSQDITGTRIQNWQTAYGWGDHSTAGYLTAEADTLATVTGRGSTTTNTIGTGSHTISDGKLVVDVAGASSGGQQTFGIELKNTNDTAFTADALQAYNATTGWDQNDRVSWMASSRANDASIFTWMTESNTSVHYDRIVQLRSATDHTQGMRSWIFYHYDGAGTGSGDFQTPVGSLFDIIYRSGASQYTAYRFKHDRLEAPEYRVGTQLVIDSSRNATFANLHVGSTSNLADGTDPSISADSIYASKVVTPKLVFLNDSAGDDNYITCNDANNAYTVNGTESAAWYAFIGDKYTDPLGANNSGAIVASFFKGKEIELSGAMQAGSFGVGVDDPYYKVDVRFNSSDTGLTGGTSGNWGGNGIRVENTNSGVGTLALAHFRTGDSDWHIGNERVGQDEANFVFMHEGSTKVLFDKDGKIESNAFESTVESAEYSLIKQTGQTFTPTASGVTGLAIINNGTAASYSIFEAQTGAGAALDVRNNGDVRVLNNLLINGTTRINSAGNATLGTTTTGALTATSITGTSLSISGAFSIDSLASTGTVSGSQFRASFGDQNDPAYTFKNDDDTGMYGAAGQVKFSVGGSNRMTIGATATTVTGRISVVGDIQAGTVPQTVIDSSRNLTNIGTVSSGAITVNGHIQQNNNNELRGKDTGGSARTLVRVTNGDTMQVGWSGAGDVEFIGGGSYTSRMAIKNTTGNIEINSQLLIANTAASSTPLTLGSSSQTNYTYLGMDTSAHSDEAYLIAYGGAHATQAGDFAMKNLQPSGDIYFELANSIIPLVLSSSGATFSKTSTGSTTQLATFLNPGGNANNGVKLWLSGTNATDRGAYIEAVAESTANNHTLRFGVSASASTPAEVMRLSSTGVTTENSIFIKKGSTSGTFLDFQKSDGTVVGRINYSDGDNLAIFGTATNHGGMNFVEGKIIPVSGGSEANDAIQLGDGTRNWSALYTQEVFVGATNVLTDDRKLRNIHRLGVNTSDPSVKLDVVNGTMGAVTNRNSTYSMTTFYAEDAHIDVLSSSAGTWGSSINLREAHSGAFRNSWSISRKTGTAPDLNFNFGTANDHNVGNIKVVFSSTGDITATTAEFSTALDRALTVASTDATTGIQFTDNSDTAYFYYRGNDDRFYTTSAQFSVNGDTLASGYNFQVNGAANITGGARISGPLTLAGSTSQINMQEDHYVFRSFQVDGVDNNQTFYILLCEDAGNNDVNGTITMDRTSGLRHACSLDILISSGSSLTPVGTMRSMGVTGSSATPTYRLVKGTHSDNKVYIAVKVYNPDNYHETSGAYFTGRIKTTVSSNEFAVVTSLTSESDFDVHSSHEINGSDVMTGNEADTLDSVTDRGATTTNDITVGRVIGTAANGSNLYALTLTRSGTGTTTPDLIGSNDTLVLGTSSSVKAVSFDATDGADFAGALSSGGTTILSSTRRFYASSGTTVKAAYSFDGDSGTGISRTAAGRLDFLSSGAVKAYIQTGSSNPITPTMYVDGYTQITGDLDVDADLSVGGDITASGNTVAAEVGKFDGSGITPASCKLHVGAINNTSSSAIAQFGGFIRVGGSVIIHDGPAASRQNHIEFEGTDITFRTVAGDATGVIKTNGYKIGTATTPVITSNRDFNGVNANFSGNINLNTVGQQINLGSTTGQAAYIRHGDNDNNAGSVSIGSDNRIDFIESDNGTVAFKFHTNDGHFISSGNTEVEGNLIVHCGNNAGSTAKIRSIGQAGDPCLEFSDNGGDQHWAIGADDRDVGYFTVRFNGSTAFPNDWTSNGSMCFEINGGSTNKDIVFNGNVTAYSDIRIKENIEQIPDALSKVHAIRGVTYDRIDSDDGRRTGVIAQEVEAVLPEVVRDSKDGIKSVDYGNMVGLLIEALKEADQKIESLTKRIEELEHGNN